MAPLIRRLAGRGSSVLHCLVIALAPLPMGSTQPATVALWCVVLGVALLLAASLELRPFQLVFIGLVSLLGAAYGMVLHEQISLHPWFARPHPIWNEASELLGEDLEGVGAIVRDQPWFSIGPPLAALSSFLCGLIICRDRGYARNLLQVVAWSGTAYALYGIALAFVDPVTMNQRSRSLVLTSTFTNRNTAAVYFGACSVVWLLFFCESIRRIYRGSKDSPRPTYSPQWPARLILLLVLMFGSMLATFMTSSKAGVGLSLLSFVIAITAFFYRDLARRRIIFWAFAAGGGLALLSLPLLAGNVVARFSEQGLIDHTRLSLYRSTWRLIADKPWFGSGLGSFAWTFPAYRADEISTYGVYDRAHNSLLEIAAEAGLPLAGLVVVGWLVVLSVLVLGIRVRRRNRVVPAAAFSIALLAVLHSLVDFSIQIPGFAIVVFGVTGAGLAQSFRSTA